MRMKLLSTQEREAIICDFHKRLDRSRISVAIIAVRIYDVVASNEDGSLSANQTGRAVLFSFPASTVRWRNSRRTGWSVFNQVLIALIRKIVVCDRYRTYRENGECDIAQISDCNRILDSNHELNETKNSVRNVSRCKQKRQLY